MKKKPSSTTQDCETINLHGTIINIYSDHVDFMKEVDTDEYMFTELAKRRMTYLMDEGFLERKSITVNIKEIPKVS